MPQILGTFFGGMGGYPSSIEVLPISKVTNSAVAHHICFSELCLICLFDLFRYELSCERMYVDQIYEGFHSTEGQQHLYLLQCNDMIHS